VIGATLRHRGLCTYGGTFATHQQPRAWLWA
jgi:hypothetical protein